MRYHCYICGTSVTSELPDEATIRALLVCPECLEGANEPALTAVLTDMIERQQARADLAGPAQES